MLGALVAVALPAFGDGTSGERLFRSSLVGAPGSGRTIRTVPSGGAPWTIDDDSEARLSTNGRLRADIEGLLITGTGTANDGTTGSVTQVVAALTCANQASGDSGAPEIVSSSAVPLSSEGDARVDQTIPLPSTCLGPIVLIRANSATGPWIAISGF